MRTFTNGTDVLDAVDRSDDTWNFRRKDLEIPLTGRSSWWGAFRRGDHITVEIDGLTRAVDVRILGRGFAPQLGAIVGAEGGSIRFEVPRDGVYHLRLDGPPRRRLAFRLRVRIPVRERRVLRPARALTRQGVA